MRRGVFSCLLLFLALSGFAQAQQRPGSVLTLGSQVPDFRFSATPDSMTHLAAYRGKVILLNFFATWCPPCNAEFPHLEKEIWAQYKDRPDFVLLAFGREHNWKEVKAFAKQKQVTFPVYPDPYRNVFKLFAQAYIPRNVVINAEGKIIYESIGYKPREFERLKTLLDKQLDL